MTWETLTADSASDWAGRLWTVLMVVWFVVWFQTPLREPNRSARNLAFTCRNVLFLGLDGAGKRSEDTADRPLSRR